MLTRRLLFPTFAIGVLLALAADTATIAQTYTKLHDFNCNNEGCGPIGLLAEGRDGQLYGTGGSGGPYSFGTVFRVTTSGAVTTLASFNWDNGASPESGQTLGTDGNFYGATSSGGSSRYGTAYRISPTGALVTLHGFDISECCPRAAPVQAKDGNFYAVTNGFPAGEAYRISRSGAFKVLTTSVPSTSYAPLLQAADSRLYGVTAGGVNSACGAVFSMSTTGVLRNAYPFFDPTYGCHPEGGLVQDSAGYLYGTTVQGEQSGYGNGVIFKLKPTTGVLTVIHQFDYSSGGGSHDGMLLATDGNLYGVAYNGGIGNNGVLFKITRTGSYTVLHYFEGTDGSYPHSPPMQHTNGKIYGLTGGGGAYGRGVFYSYDAGLSPFVALMSTSGTPGETVQILGQGFNTASSVKFGTGSANFTIVSDTYMTAAVPKEGTSGYVTVTLGSGTLTSNKKFKVVPMIISFSPTSGPVGSKVTITGGGFYGATKVTFGGVKATSFSVDSGSQITATVPTSAVTGKIKVMTPGGTATSKGVFTVT